MTPAPSIRTAARTWWVPVVVLLAVLGVVQVAGGFATVTGAQGRAAVAEEELALARWTLVVHGAELLDDEYDPAGPARVRVHLRATFDGERSTYALAEQLVTVQGPAGTGPLEDAPITDGERDGSFDPGVGQEITLDFRWPDAPADPGTVRVLVRDEAEDEGFITGPAWEVQAAPVLHVDLPCPDRRTR